MHEASRLKDKLCGRVGTLVGAIRKHAGQEGGFLRAARSVTTRTFKGEWRCGHYDNRGNITRSAPDLQRTCDGSAFESISEYAAEISGADAKYDGSWFGGRAFLVSPAKSATGQFV